MLLRRRLFHLSAVLLPLISPFANAQAPLADVLSKANPDADPSWQTEVFSSRAGKQLSAIVAHLAPKKAKEGTPALEKITSPEFSAPLLRPPLVEVASTNGFQTLRPASTNTSADLISKAGALRRVLTPLKEALGDLSSARAKTKVVSVEPLPENTVRTLVYLEATNQKGIQINAEWNCTWQTSPSDPDHPLLAGIEILRYEEIHAISPKIFQDETQTLIGKNLSYQNQLLRGANHWHGNLDVAFGIFQGNQGLAIGDANGDGLDDLYLCQPDGLPNLLYLRNSDGTLRDASKESGLDILDISRGVLFVDLDNDTDQDLVLTHRFAVSVFENTGEAKFKRHLTIPVESRVAGVSAADYDHDGDLDFYLCGYSPRSKTSASDIFANPVPYEDAKNGAFNYLFRNDGNLAFSDVTTGSGLDQNNTQFSFTAVWEDYDNDGDLDLYVANDFGRNNLYRNALIPSGNARFEDVAELSGTLDIAAGMSASWGDTNRDGLMDLYVSNMWSSAGHRIAYQNQFRENTKNDENTKSLIRRHARGNSLFHNTGGDSPFTDDSLATGTAMGRWAWGSLVMDLNNDGWEDIYVANGFMSAPETGDL